MNHKKTLVGLSLIMATVIPTASADSLSQKRQQAAQLQSEMAHASQKVAQDKKQTSALQMAVNSYTASINSVQQQANANQAQIAALNKQLKDLQSKISENEVQLQKYQDEFNNDVKIMYEDGSASYLSVLFSSTSFSDLIDRMQMLSIISKHDNDLAAQIQTLRDSLVKQQSSKKSTVATLNKKQADYSALLVTEKNLKANKQHSLYQASLQLKQDNERHRMLESQVQLTQSEIAAIVAATQSAENKMSDAGYVQQAEQNLSQVDSSALIKYAEQYIGLPYIWGGTTPHPGFDCSGYTQYVYGHFGVHLGRTAADQFAQGVPVSRGSLQPGDLVFFSTYAPGATHVGIYIGGGMMVNAEDAGLMITSLGNSYWSARYIGARRVLK